MTPLKSLRAWSLISVNFLIYCIPGPSLSCTNLKLRYPETFSVSDSPIESSTYPTSRFRQEPGGEMQISPLLCSCMGKWQQEAERAVQPLLAASTHCGTHTAPLVLQRTGTNQAQSLNILVAGGEHLSPKLSAELHRAGPSYRGCWMPDTPFAVFRLQRNMRGKKKKKNSLRNTCSVRASQAVQPSAGVVSPV